MGLEEWKELPDFEKGDRVQIVDGPFEEFIGVVEEINLQQKRARVLVSMFGRETPLDLEFYQIEKI